MGEMVAMANDRNIQAELYQTIKEHNHRKRERERSETRCATAATEDSYNSQSGGGNHGAGR
jgi:hypothetical protein